MCDFKPTKLGLVSSLLCMFYMDSKRIVPYIFFFFFFLNTFADVTHTESRDSQVVWVSESWLKGQEFEYWQENFILHCQLSVLTHFSNCHIPMSPQYCMEWSTMVHGCMVYTECTKTAAASHGTSHLNTKQCCKHTTSVDIENIYKKYKKKCNESALYKSYHHHPPYSSAPPLMQELCILH